MRIILASASPRRRELLEQIGLEFEIKVSNVEENATSILPGELVEELSEQKAEAVLSEVEPGEEAVLVIGADTVVVLDDSILGKPRTREAAVKMLQMLSGREHQVYTGVTLLYRPGSAVDVRDIGHDGADSDRPGEDVADNNSTGNDSTGNNSIGNDSAGYDAADCGETGREGIDSNGSGRKCLLQRVQSRTFHEMTKVFFYPMTEAEIDSYVSTGDPMDKAGAYGIQGLFARFVQGIEGDYNNVVGLPVGRLYQEAKEWLEA